MNVLEAISKTTVKLLIKEPFYGHFFSHINKQISEKISRVAISLGENNNFVLAVNPNYWKELITEDQRMGCIKHQVLHLALKHVFKAKNFGNKELFHIAADLVVNQYLLPEQLTEDAITIHDFKMLLLEPFRSLEYYYYKLSILPTFNQDTVSKKGNKELGQDTLTPSTNNSKPQDEHKEWEEIVTLEGAETSFLMDVIDNGLEQSGKRLNTIEYGLLPAEIQTIITEATERFTQIVNWKRMLKLFSESSKKTFIKTTLKRPSKRYGTTPGIKIKRKQKLLIAVDTSGSIAVNELALFFGEINHIWRQSSEIMIVECDAAIQKKYDYKGTLPATIKGGGGTCFDPPINYGNTTYHPDAIIYFTDGYADEPKIKSRCPILWMITSDGITSKNWEFLPGRKIKFPKNLGH